MFSLNHQKSSILSKRMNVKLYEVIQNLIKNIRINNIEYNINI